MESFEYVRGVLDAYRATPGTCGAIRRADRTFALRLFDRGVPLTVVENALVLACARRLARPADAPRLGVIRSLAYFAPVIDEVLGLRVDDAYFEHLRARLTPLRGQR
ncbi:MAG: hypothetical protein NTV52_00500 [Acidobacteria bacterium]|nr:hypothetical protein [Acidobacteriota bacterium]